MNKLLKLVTIGLGFGTLVGLLGMIPISSKPLAASASAGPAVTVANVPLPVSPTGTQTVAGTVSVGNTPSVNAQQSGTWNVGINGIPSVSITGTPTVALATNSLTIGNTGTTPVPVRDVDGGFRQPFAVFLGSGVNSDFTVPANSALVIETISIAATGTQGSPNGYYFPQLLLTTGGTTTGFWLPVTATPFGGAGAVHYIGGIETRLYADPGTVVTFRSDGEAFVLQRHAAISGFLVTCGAGAGCPLP